MMIKNNEKKEKQEKKWQFERHVDNCRITDKNHHNFTQYVTFIVETRDKGNDSVGTTH